MMCDFAPRRLVSAHRANGGSKWDLRKQRPAAGVPTVKDSGHTFPILFESLAVTTDGNWCCIRLVWDGTNRRLYVDDIVVAEDTQAGWSRHCSVALNIGCDKQMTPGMSWISLIDDVRIYNSAVKP